MSDIVVTINPPNSTSVSIGAPVSNHAITHAPSGSDSLENYYYPRSNPSGYAGSGDFATTGYVADVSGAIVSQINFPSNVVFTTGDQNISGVKNFYSRPTVNGTGVLLSGEAAAASTGYLTGYVSKTESGVFYPTSNPSGYVTGVDLSLYATISYSTGISGHLQQQISSLQNATGSYVTGNVVRSNETGGFLVASDLSPYQTVSQSTGISGYLQSQIDGIDLSALNTATGVLNSGVTNLEGQTGLYVLKAESGQFYPVSNPSGYITGINLSSYATVYLVTGVSGYLQGQVSSLQSQTGSYLTGESDPLFAASTAYQITPTLTGNWTNAYENSLTGISVVGSTTKTITLYQRDGGVLTADFTDSEGTGSGSDFYIYSGSFNASNGNLTLNRTGDNGSVVVPMDGRYALLTGATGISGYLQNQIDAIDLSALEAATGNLNGRVLVLEGQTGSYVTGNVIRPSDTGAFYTINNPSGYITGVDLSNYASIAQLTGASGHLQGQISILNGQTGDFYPRSNPSGYITGIDLGGYVTGDVVRPSETGSFVIDSDLAIYQTIVGSTGISGYLQGQISNINGVTGLFVTGQVVRPSETGSFLTTGAADLRFYPLNSNPSSYLVASDVSGFTTTGYVTGISGYLQTQISSNYNNSITGIDIIGSSNKTINLYQQDGSVISGSFVDSQGTGDSPIDYVALTGDQNISGVKNFYSRPTVNGTGVLLSGEASGGGAINVNDSNLIISISMFS